MLHFCATAIRRAVVPVAVGQGCDWMVEEVERKKPSEASDEGSRSGAWVDGWMIHSFA